LWGFQKGEAFYLVYTNLSVRARTILGGGYLKISQIGGL